MIFQVRSLASYNPHPTRKYSTTLSRSLSLGEDQPAALLTIRCPPFWFNRVGRIAVPSGN